MTIPGISPFSALLILAETGDIDWFDSPEKLCSYAGLVPKVHQSGDTLRIGGIKKEANNLLRWIMVESAWFHINHVHNCPESHIPQFYERLKENKPTKVAMIAATRKLTKVIFWMLKKKEEFHPEGYDPRTSH